MSSDLSMKRYVQGQRDHYDSNPDQEAALYKRDLEAHGFPHATNQAIIDQGLHGVSDHLHANTSERMAIAALETPEKQIPALQKIRARMVGGDDGTAPDNDEAEVREYLRKRTADVKSGDRKVGNRERRRSVR